VKDRPRVLVVLKRSSYRKHVEQERDERIQSLLRSGDPTVQRMLPGHLDHEETVDEVRSSLAELGARVTIEADPRRLHANGETLALSPEKGGFDLVVTVGGDGTLLAASHHVGRGVPILGVNSAPRHSVGFFCAAKKGSVKETLSAALTGALPRVNLARMKVLLNDMCLHKRVLNEALFCHVSPAATSRYILRVELGDGGFIEEEQKSSGVWAGPAAGSTAAQRSAGGRVLPLASEKLQFVVREAYTPYGEHLRLTVGLVDERGRLVLRSKMRKARIFLDGEHNAYDVTIGDVIVMERSEDSLTVLGLTRNGEPTSRPSPASSQRSGRKARRNTKPA
jgi:NAD+ kinase